MKRLIGWREASKSSLGSAPRSRLSSSSMLALSAVIALSTASAMAQEAASPPAAAERAMAEPDSIVVTAQRRSERLIDVPMSIVAVTAETLENSGVRSLSDIGQIAPGVQVNFNGGFSNPSIRGISSLTNGKGFDNNVAVYVDGFIVPDMITVNTDLGNVESVQVLKGPQGALYGRNATGGAILITTRAPSDTFTGNFQAGRATFNETLLSGYVSGPITDGLSFSAAAYRRWSDGYIKLSNPTTIGGPTVGDASPRDQRSARLKLAWDPTENLKITLGYNYALNSDNRGNLYTPTAYAPPSVGTPPNYSADPKQKSYNGANINKGVSNEYTLTASLDTSFGTLTSYTGVARRDYDLLFDFDGSYSDLVYIQTGGKIDSEQQTLVLNGKAFDALDFVIGGEYYHERRYGGATRPGGPKDGGSITLSNGIPVSEQIATSVGTAWAGFADVTYKVTDRLSLTAGARYSTEKKDGFFSNQTAAQFGTNAYSFAPTWKTASWDGFTPRASIRYEVARNANVYASFSKGFRAGAWSSSGAPTPALFLPLNPEKATAYEVGFKLSRGAFRFETAAFLSDYTDIHIGAVVPDPFCTAAPCGLRVLTLNGPGARIYGVDGMVEFRVAEGLNLRASAAWLKARYNTFPNAVGTGLNITTNQNVGSQTQDWSGHQMARAPEFSGNVGGDYKHDLGFGILRLSANAAFTTSFAPANPSLFGPLAGSLANKQRYRTGGYTLVNGEIALLSPSENVSLALYVRNLFDVSYRSTYSGLSFGDYSTYAEPRVVGVRAGFNF